MILSCYICKIFVNDLTLPISCIDHDKSQPCDRFEPANLSTGIVVCDGGYVCTHPQRDGVSLVEFPNHYHVPTRKTREFLEEIRDLLTKYDAFK